MAGWTRYGGIGCGCEDVETENRIEMGVKIEKLGNIGRRAMAISKEGEKNRETETQGEWHSVIISVFYFGKTKLSRLDRLCLSLPFLLGAVVAPDWILPD